MKVRDNLIKRFMRLYPQELKEFERFLEEKKDRDAWLGRDPSAWWNSLRDHLNEMVDKMNKTKT